MMSCIRLFFILCSVLTPALCCDWRHYRRYSNNSLTFIRLMGGPLTKEKSPVPFPEKLNKLIRNAEVETKLVFIRDNLKEIAHLYHHGNRSSVTWDTHTTTKFLTNIDRQIEELNTCVSTNKTADHRLRKYYKRLVTRILGHTGGSTSSWELLRKETKLRLDHLDLLVTQFIDHLMTLH
uniref:Interferon a3-like n=1 Tax=Mastacembelus armatus TaxID=205130 RepID=A0A7N9AWX2_9TELE